MAPLIAARTCADSVRADAVIVGTELRTGLRVENGARVAAARVRVTNNELGAMAADGAAIRFEDCTFAGNDADVVTASPGGDEPGHIYTNARSLRVFVPSAQESTDVQPLSAAPSTFLEADDRAFTALRQVRRARATHVPADCMLQTAVR